jgi:glycosyltransferase involved in cell wall biosynthesis
LKLTIVASGFQESRQMTKPWSFGLKTAVLPSSSSGFAGTVGHCGDAAVVAVATPIEHHGGHPGVFGALADQLGAPVMFTGFLRDPGKVYAAADIVAHTSTAPEPFGRTVIEAMIAGCPVVVANAGALPEIVVDGVTGILTPPGDVVALADALVSLLTSE